MVLERNRLELHWDKVQYPEEGVAVLYGAYLCGPVFKDAAQIQDNDRLTLDLTKQHQMYIPNFYQATLTWKRAIHKIEQGKVFLEEAIVKNKFLTSLERLSDEDYILVDCKGHDHRSHAYNLIYLAQVMIKERRTKY